MEGRPIKEKITYCIIFALCLLTFTGCTSLSQKDYVDSMARDGGQKEQEPQKGMRKELPIHPTIAAEGMDVEKYMAAGYLDEMTLEEKIHQMLFLHYRGEAVSQLEEYQLGGVILFADFFKNKTPETAAQAISDMQAVSRIPMLIGVDEEGGSVIRISKYKAFSDKKFCSPQELYESGGMEEIVRDTKQKAGLLLGLGINVNLAPVADVSTEPSDYIYNRTFGKNAEETAEYVSAVVSRMKESKIGSVLKHFPGYGNNRDTHKGFAIDQRPYESFEESDFLPFQAGIDKGADSILVSHNIVVCIDERLPASLSPKVHDILRQQLGFDGVIMTDDLIMDAIAEGDFEKPPEVLAVLAGNDMMITTDYEHSASVLEEAVSQGIISEEMIDKAVIRILIWKMDLGLLE